MQYLLLYVMQNGGDIFVATVDGGRSPVSLVLYNSVQRGNGALMDVTQKIGATWKRSVRDIGGYWIGTARWDGTRRELLDVFQNGLQWELREMHGGRMTWQGFLAGMSLTLDGQTYVRDWAELANRVKTVYTWIGTNLITNSSCESAAWAAWGTPSTCERSSAWASEGTYSTHVVTDAAEEGVQVQSSITVIPRREYQARVTVKIVSGEWRLELADAQAVVDSYVISEPGEWVLYATVPETNTSTVIGMRLVCSNASGELYGDAAVFQLAPARAETGWYQDTVSQTEYGTREAILLQGGLTNAQANALATRYLAEHRWALAIPPTTIRPIGDDREDTLALTFLGYVFTLSNRHTQLTGQDAQASAAVSSLLAEASEFIIPGSIQQNTLSVHIDDTEALRVWDALRVIIEAGDTSGNRWTGGVYNDRRFDYGAASSVAVARQRAGKLFSMSGGVLEGWYARPGYVLLDDLPSFYDVAGVGQPNAVWMSEVEFDLGKHLAGKPAITYKR